MKAKSESPMLRVSEITVSYHPKFIASQRPVVISSRDAYELLLAKWDYSRSSGWSSSMCYCSTRRTG